MQDPDFINWLLSSETPSIRYFTLRQLLGRDEGDPEVAAARAAIMTAGPVPEILAGQTPEGNWRGERGYYTPKYVSTHWSMLLLAELGADGQDPRVRRGAAFMLAATEAELRRGGRGMTCFWGNLLRYTLHAGCTDDERTALAVDYLVRDGLENGWRCRINDDLPCAWGAARALWGLAALPVLGRTPEVRDAQAQGLAFLLEAHHLEQGDYPGPGVSRLWQRLNFPLFYQADVLFVLRVVAELHAIEHPRARAPLEWLDARRRADGQWRGAGPFRQRTWPALGGPAETHRWVSLQAAAILEQAWGGCGMTAGLAHFPAGRK